MSRKFRLKNINATRNCFPEGTEQNKLMNKKHKKVCATLSYIEYFFVF